MDEKKPQDNSVEATDKSEDKPCSISRKQDDPRYQRASDIAVSAALSRHKSRPFYDEDEMLEYTRFLKRDIYDSMMDRYGY